MSFLEAINPLNILASVIDAFTPDTPEQSIGKLLKKFETDKNADPAEIMQKIQETLTNTLGIRDIDGCCSAEMEEKHPNLAAMSKEIAEMEENQIPDDQMLSNLAKSQSNGGSTTEPDTQSRNRSASDLTY